MKITNLKAMAAKVMTVGLLAGAVVMAAPAKAEAQQFAVGVQVGYPHYGYGPDYYARLRFDERRRAEFLRHEEWVRAHECGRYPYQRWAR